MPPPTLPVLIAAALLYGFGEGMFIPTLQDIVAGAAPPSSAARSSPCGSAPPAPGRRSGRSMAAAVYGATSTGTTFVLGGAVAAGLVVYELVGRFGGRRATARRPDRTAHRGACVADRSTGARSS